MGIVWAFAAAIMWGLVYTLDQRILLVLPPATLLFIDSLLTAVLVLPLAIFQGINFTALLASSSGTRFLILSSLDLALLANFSIFSGIRLLGASTASILEIGYPFFVVVFSYLILGAKPSPMVVAGAILIFAGSAIVIAYR